MSLGLAIALAAAEAGGPGAPDQAAAQVRVRALIGDARCDADSQCRSIGIGAKACGGPQAYLAWSITGTDQAALFREVAVLERAEQAANARDGRASNCSVVRDPGAFCAAQNESASVAGTAPRHCQLQRATPGGGATAR